MYVCIHIHENDFCQGCILWPGLRTQWPRKPRPAAWSCAAAGSHLADEPSRLSFTPGGTRLGQVLPTLLSLVDNFAAQCWNVCQSPRIALAVIWSAKTLYFQRWIRFLCFPFPCAQECPGTCFKVKPLLVSERNPSLSFPRNVQLGSVLSSH